ncbi:MAG TPA: heavy metal translocating P-type ATPase metal-binding domain-containing protein [Steroidobacteraceae bacterium]|nr:heavy metal translocating P-type ATPase metal-binding domain-containing protein [Steroidobacteraceae bacterium]
MRNAVVEESCFHCGGPLPWTARPTLEVDGVPRAVCCAGCAAAATLILSQGLGRYYEFRESPGPRAPGDTRDWRVFDREASLRRYTHERADGEREASLQIEGLHCAACAWLIESSLRRVSGVTDIQVNPAAARAALRFDPHRVSFGAVLAAIQALGFVPLPLAFTAGASADVNAERRTALKRLAVAGFGMMQVMTYATSLYAGAMDGMAPDLEQLLRFVSLIVATPVVLYAAQPFFVGAWRSLRARTPGMDVPVALSIGAAYLWSVVATLRGSGTVYFDSAVMFTFFLLLGRYIEMSLRHRSGLQHDALARLLPESVLRLRGLGTERVIADELRAGDRVRVLPGERVPADGTIASGTTEVDESLLTGESLPRLRAAGDPVLAGTLNLTGPIEMTLERVGQSSTLAAVARLLERAQGSRPRVADLADRFAVWFVSAVLLLAAAAGLYWLQVDAARAFPTVLAVLVVTCPCALSLATPAALAAATSALAREGLLVTRTRAIERLARADCLVLDKTGTLTRGEPRLEEVTLLDPRLSAERCLAVAAALESHSGHPLARAFAHLEPAAQASDVRCVPGRGVEATVAGVYYRIGRLDYVLEACPDARTRAVAPGDEERTSVALGDRAGLLTVFHLTDALRADARAALERLRSLGLVPQIASGDRPGAVAAIARELGSLAQRADLSAADKLALVQALQAAGHRVAMVGDGVNDAPVLAAADVSVAIGSGTDLAKVSADLVLLGEGLTPLADAVLISRRTLRVIRQNLTWAALYNATAVPLAAAGYLEPWMAAIGMSMSSLLVVLNAMRLVRRSPARVVRLHEHTAPAGAHA